MADLIIEAKRRNLSGLNFSSFGQNLSRQKLSSQGSRVGSRESSVAFMQAKQKLLTKQKVKQRQRKAAAAAAGNSFSCWTCRRFDFYFAMFSLLLQYLAKFLPKSLSCGGGRCVALSCPALDRALKLIIHAGHVNMIVMPADDGRLTESESKWNLRRHFKHAIDSMYPPPFSCSSSSSSCSSSCSSDCPGLDKLKDLSGLHVLLTA